MSTIGSPRALDEWMLVDDDAEVVAPAPPEEVRNEDKNDRSQASTDTVAGDSRESGTATATGVPEGFHRIRLRIGEQTRPAYFKATQSVQGFTEQFFSEELANRKRIRLIYMGMLLIQDRTMGEFGIEEDGVIHAVINDAPPSPHPEAAQEVVLKGLANPANTLLLTTGLFLYGLWTLMYHYPHLFSWKAVFMLAALSAVHISATVSRLTS